MHAAEDASTPAEIVLENAIKRFGVLAVTGRATLSAGEIIRMNTCENIITAYEMRAKSTSWPQWVKDNPGLAAVLHDAERVANGRS